MCYHRATLDAAPSETAIPISPVSGLGASPGRVNDEWRQAAWYYAANLSSYVLPLFTFMYLARVLGPVEWGRLAAFHSLGLYASQVIEYGFNFGAARAAIHNTSCR